MSHADDSDAFGDYEVARDWRCVFDVFPPHGWKVLFAILALFAIAVALWG